jgi:hypothetical protein
MRPDSCANWAHNGLGFANNVNEVPVVGDWNGGGIDTVYGLVNSNTNATATPSSPPIALAGG